ncbi:hypothetical protein [Anaeroselena agilis]|uniref:Poly A polymerase head domain-containing protein n=1 Tax=Anaeroselena agilis TaxID=3063788 RepID=A0ABU3NWB1_9FIRM|nr:hypothetical protein [Selenomonadales bacterium 4137-cl]
MNHDPASLLVCHPRAPLLDAIGRRCAEAGFRAAAVGGFVRDLLLGIISQDIDIVVEGDAIFCAKLLAARLGGAVVKTSRFGTAVVMVGGTRLDLAMARTESYSRPGALPEVSPGTLADDLWRRDFTVNAIALDIGPGYFGRLIDEVGGRKDLTARTIRILHAGSFSDDPTRMLRAVRLAHRLRFSFADPTAARLREAVCNRNWLTVGSHRLGREVRLLFRENDLPGLFRSLDRWGMFRPIFATVPTAAKLDALARIDEAVASLALLGHRCDRTAVAALIIGGRAGFWLQCESGLETPDRLRAVSGALASPGAGDRLHVMLADIPPAMLAYLWIMCQNEEERFRLQSALAGISRPRPSMGGRASFDSLSSEPHKEDN